MSVKPISSSDIGCLLIFLALLFVVPATVIGLFLGTIGAIVKWMVG